MHRVPFRRGLCAVSAQQGSAGTGPATALLFSFGSPDHGQLGAGQPSKPSAGSTAPVAMQVMLPRHVPASPPSESEATADPTAASVSFRARMVSAGLNHSLAVSADSGRVYAWGKAAHGRLGIGKSGSKKDAFEPVEVRFDPDDATEVYQSGIRDISAGDFASGIVARNGDLYTFGYGGGFLFGQGPLGHGDRKSRYQPQRVLGLEGEKVDSVSMGSYHGAVLLESGDVFSFGKGDWGRLGLGANYDAPVPAYMLFFKDKPVKQIALGSSHSAAVTRDGRLYTWGKNEHYQLGAESSGAYYGGAGFDAASSPQIVPFFLNMGKAVRQISVDASFSAAVTEDGELYAWGDRRLVVPTRMHLGAPGDDVCVRQVSVGQHHIVALADDGRLFCMGRNTAGQLGVDRKNAGANFKEFVEATSILKSPSLQGKTIVGVSAGGAFNLLLATS